MYVGNGKCGEEMIGRLIYNSEKFRAKSFHLHKHKQKLKLGESCDSLSSISCQGYKTKDRGVCSPGGNSETTERFACPSLTQPTACPTFTLHFTMKSKKKMF